MMSLPDMWLGLYWVPGHAGVRGNVIADEPAMGGSVLGYLDLSRPWESLGEIYRKDLVVG